MPATYAQRNLSVKPILHAVAFSGASFPAILCYMERKARSKERPYQPSYIKQWRNSKGLTQAQLIARIIELAGEGEIDDPSLRVPRTEASLSRIENGKQPYNQAILEVVGAALQVRPGHLVERDPTKEGKVISLLDRATPSQMLQIEAVIEAILRTGTR